MYFGVNGRVCKKAGMRDGIFGPDNWGGKELNGATVIPPRCRPGLWAHGGNRFEEDERERSWRAAPQRGQGLQQEEEAGVAKRARKRFW